MQRVHQAAEAKRVGQQNELLPVRRAFLAHRGQELDGIQPFFGRQIHLAREIMQMPRERGHDLLQARVGRGLPSDPAPLL